MIKALNTFTFKACNLTDEKSVKLFENLSGNTKKNRIQAKKNQDILVPFMGRLETENPFDEFKKAVEDSILKKSGGNKKKFGPDKSYFKESDDVGMTLSMHQPWASLVVHGFKRFEGRAWTHKYRGPLWIHATQQKPSKELIKQIEDMYADFYESIGEDRPEFPERYLTGVLLGRCDLIDVISYGEYEDTIPKKLQEPTESENLLVVKNPCILDIPLGMQGQPGIYKMQKELWYGVKDLIKKVPYEWWPPEDLKNNLAGRFDLYPDEFVEWSRDDTINYVEKHQIVKNPDQQ